MKTRSVIIGVSVFFGVLGTGLLSGCVRGKTLGTVVGGQ